MSNIGLYLLNGPHMRTSTMQVFLHAIIMNSNGALSVMEWCSVLLQLSSGYCYVTSQVGTELRDDDQRLGFDSPHL